MTARVAAEPINGIELARNVEQDQFLPLNLDPDHPA